jgi:putative ABC transport system permease protein
MKHSPPRWADKFLTWYCREDLLEEIQGDVYELYERTATASKRKADLHFIWNILRFFRLKNIRKRSSPYDRQFSIAMLKNILIVAFRNFFRQPTHSILNVLGLAVGFTCAFLVLVWVSYEHSFDKFNHDPDQLFKIYSHVEANGNIQTYGVASAAIDVSSIPDVSQAVSISSGSRWPHVLCFKPEEKGKECVYLNGVYANENLFSVFNFPILQGDQHPLTQPNTIAISQNMANMLFNAEDPIGKTIKIDGWQPVTIASVFENVPGNSTIQLDFAMPYSMLKKLWGIDDAGLAQNFFNIYLRTTSGISTSDLNVKLNDVRVVTEEYKAQHIRYQALPLSDWRLNANFEDGQQAGGRIEYVILFVIIGVLVTLMAVINFINMTTARATTRAKEIGIRKVTGAFRSTIMLQFAGEAFLIVFVAFLIAAGTTQLFLPFFNSLLGEQINFALWQGNVPLYLLTFLLIVALLAGLYPAFILSSYKPVNILKGIYGNVSGSQRLRKMLLVMQLSISIGIIVFSGVLYVQLNFVTKKNLGFDRLNMIRVEPTARLLKSFDVFKNELVKHPSITHVGAANSNPLNTGGGNTGISWPGKPKDLRVVFKTIGCSPEFPETMGLRIIDGRNFQSQPGDTLHTEALVTQDAVATMGLKNPIGEIIQVGNASCVIIGVVNDFHTASLHEARMPAVVYRTEYKYNSALYVRYQPNTAKESLAALSDVYKKLEPDFTMKYWFQDDTFNELYKTEIIASRLIVGFTVIALIIAALGIVGLAAFNTLRKTKEIGVRRVLGASTAQILSLLFNEFSFLLILSILIAGPLAWYAADQWLQGYAYRTPMPWWIFGATFAGIGLLIATIVVGQGLRTVTANPTKALRAE